MLPCIQKFKKECDEYFVNKHRNNERRGIGGIFYDYQRPIGAAGCGLLDELWQGLRQCLSPCLYAHRGKTKGHALSLPPTNTGRKSRRGRYTEFNLVHDRGTIFGLKTNGRIESILMSLPPPFGLIITISPMQEQPEDKLQQVCPAADQLG